MNGKKRPFPQNTIRKKVKMRLSAQPDFDGKTKKERIGATETVHLLLIS